MFRKQIFLVMVLTGLLYTTGHSQQKVTPKYPSLFWEITGNGLKKPSYLFGTMHVSSKMVFHLSDSFYLAIKNVDAVALELNPDVWQGQMVSMNKLKENYADFVQEAGGDYLTENSFRISKYDDELKRALNSEPTMVNSLLYRSYESQEDFEEDTFLDLYIFQTGKKLGKRATGVENYYETEKLVMEAYADMAKEKKHKTIDMAGESRYGIVEKMQDAYRHGDLDLMDSLDIMVDPSDAFREKFLYQRNIIQANSMDTIMRNGSLFVGVGAAHLPGNRGVIELLRKMGYTLRPIKMSDRDDVQKETIDDLKVPVNFSTQRSEDGFYSVAMPGPLFEISDQNQVLNRRQYSDMSNGTYYVVTRIKTHAAYAGLAEKDVMERIDSMLYENIPGRILSKKSITQNGYPGYDILNRTRRGDLQRYTIIITPFEVLVFKMSGKENYVQGTEADQFFNSIKLKEANKGSVLFQPVQGGFAVQLPQYPSEYLNPNTSVGGERWEYEAVDKNTGDAYLVFKKSNYNFNFLEEDTFDLSLMEESFRDPDQFAKQLQRKIGSFNGYPCLDVKEKMKDGSEVYAKYIIRGPHYYVIAAKTKNKKTDFSAFFNSFRFTPYNYAEPRQYTDTFMHFTVSTAVMPELDGDLRRLVEKTANDMATGSSYVGYSTYWPRPRNGLFRSEATGEEIGVTMQEYPKYYHVEDSAKFWKNEINDYYKKNDLVLYRTDTLQMDGAKGFRFILRDTNSSRTILRLLMFRDNYSCNLVSMGDTVSTGSSFINSFFNSFKPGEAPTGRSVYTNHLDEFFDDLFSKDSALHAKAQQSISSVYYGEKGIPQIVAAINRLNMGDKDYFDSKAKLIAELGYIKDTTHPQVVDHLKKIYEQTADTSLFQNEVFRALARHKTTDSYQLLKELMIQDPPVFESPYEYRSLFSSLDDSLLLCRELFPGLLQLLTIDDYKDKVLSLLVTMVDSNIVKAADYESYFTKIYFDAKVELKKQLAKDEKIMEKETKKEENTETVIYNAVYNRNKSLDDYCVLLMPFYDRNNNVQKYFEQLLGSKDAAVKMNATILLLRYKKNVADSILQKLAATDQFRGVLFSRLEKIGRLDKFPAQYRTQVDIARSLLVRNFSNIDSVVYLSRQPVAYAGKKGTVYFFKYRAKKGDDWKIGIGGLQPTNEKEVSSDIKLTAMTDKKLKADEPQDEQLQKQLKRMLFSFHKSARNYYGYNDYYSRIRRAGAYSE